MAHLTFSWIGIVFIALPFATIACSAPTSTDAEGTASESALESGQTGTYALIGSPNGEGVSVDDDLIVRVNGAEAFKDWGNGANQAMPSFQAKPGDTVRVSFFDTAGWCRGHGDVWLKGPGLAPMKVSRGWSGRDCAYHADGNRPFDEIEFTIPAFKELPYTLSGSATGAAMHVDDDMILTRNDKEVFRDWGNGANDVTASFAAKPGDAMRATFFDIGWCRAHGEMWLSGPGITPTRVGNAVDGGHCHFTGSNEPFDAIGFVIPQPKNVKYVFSRDASGAAITADDDLIVSVAGTQVFKDWGNGANEVPLTITASPGDLVTMSFYDTTGYCRSHSEIWISGPDFAATKVSLGADGGNCSFPADGSKPFHIVEFSIPRSVP